MLVTQASGECYVLSIKVINRTLIWGFRELAKLIELEQTYFFSNIAKVCFRPLCRIKVFQLWCVQISQAQLKEVYRSMQNYDEYEKLYSATFFALYINWAGTGTLRTWALVRPPCPGQAEQIGIGTFHAFARRRCLCLLKLERQLKNSPVFRAIAQTEFSYCFLHPPSDLVLKHQAGLAAQTKASDTFRIGDRS